MTQQKIERLGREIADMVYRVLISESGSVSRPAAKIAAVNAGNAAATSLQRDLRVGL